MLSAHESDVAEDIKSKSKRGQRYHFRNDVIIMMIVIFVLILLFGTFSFQYLFPGYRNVSQNMQRIKIQIC